MITHERRYYLMNGMFACMHLAHMPACTPFRQQINIHMYCLPWYTSRLKTALL